MTTKTCSTCRISQNATEFSTDKRNSDGLQSQCRTCQRARVRGNAEQVRLRQKQWREANLQQQPEMVTNGAFESSLSAPELRIKKLNWQVYQNDLQVKQLLDLGRLRVQLETGLVYATQSKTPSKAIGAVQRHGYLRTCLTNKDQRVMALVHRIVWIAAHGIPPLGQQINHRDGCKTNNALSNLELVSQSENNAHARAIGLWSPVSGLANGFAKLSQEQVEEARAMKASGLPTAEIARHLGISLGYTQRIVSGKARKVVHP